MPGRSSGGTNRTRPGLRRLRRRSTFISYTHADAEFAKGLYDHLFHTRKIPTWLDEHEIRGGDNIMHAVDKAIRRTERVVLLCSEAALNSWWVEEEIERWTEREREQRREAGEPSPIVIPVDLDGNLWSTRHRYAATIRKGLVIDAKGWNTDSTVTARCHKQVVQALARELLSPFDELTKAAKTQNG